MMRRAHRIYAPIRGTTPRLMRTEIRATRTLVGIDRSIRYLNRARDALIQVGHLDQPTLKALRRIHSRPRSGETEKETK